MPEETEYAENNQTVSENFDPVNRPVHYNSHPSGVEIIEMTEHLDFCLGNAAKYLARHGLKGSTVQDLEKAVWYLRREIELRDRRSLTAGGFTVSYSELYWVRVWKFIQADEDYSDEKVHTAMKLILFSDENIYPLERAIRLIEERIAELGEDA